MSLPFLPNHKIRAASGVIVKNREPDEKPEENQEDDQAAAIHACASALIDAVHAKDVKAAAEAMKDAFDILESMPHEEAEHPSEDEI